MKGIKIELTKEQTDFLHENNYVIVGDYIVVSVEDNEYVVLGKLVQGCYTIIEAE